MYTSIKNVYLSLKVKCSKPGCNQTIALRDLFKHENSCGTIKCQNSEHCSLSAPLIMLDKRVCSEKCYIYLKMKEKVKLSDQLMFKLLNIYADSLNNNNGIIRTFHSFFVDFSSEEEVQLVKTKAVDTIEQFNGKPYVDIQPEAADHPQALAIVAKDTKAVGAAMSFIS